MSRSYAPESLDELASIRARWQDALVLVASIGAVIESLRRAIDPSNDLLNNDVETVWLPFGRAVLDGAAPYLTLETIDNKPPLLEFFFIGIAALPYQSLILTLLFGAATAVASLCSFLYARRVTAPTTALVPPGLILLVAWQHEFKFNNEIVAVAIVALALVAISARSAGILSGIAAGFSQYVFPVSIALAYYHARGTDRLLDLRVLLWAGLVTVAQFVILGLGWGFDSVLAGIDYTFLIWEQYLHGTGEIGNLGMSKTSIVAAPNLWLDAFLQFVFTWFALLAFAVIGGILSVARGSWSETPELPTLAMLAGIFLLPYAFTVSSAYMILLGLPVATFAAIGLEPTLEAISTAIDRSSSRFRNELGATDD